MTDRPKGQQWATGWRPEPVEQATPPQQNEQPSPMTDRPTPEQLVRSWQAHGFWENLQAWGYVIVHPDDVEAGRDAYPKSNHPSREEIGRVIGWDDCRRHIFWEATND